MAHDCNSKRVQNTNRSLWCGSVHCNQKKRRKNACADLTPPLSLSLQGVQARAGMEVSPPANPDHRAGHRWLGVLWMCTPLRVCTPNTPCFTLQPVPVRHSVMITAGCACMCVCVCVCVGHYDDVQLRRTDGAPSRGHPHQRCGTAVAPGIVQEVLTSTQQAWGHSVCVDLFRLFFFGWGWEPVLDGPAPSTVLYYRTVLNKKVVHGHSHAMPTTQLGAPH